VRKREKEKPYSAQLVLVVVLVAVLLVLFVAVVARVQLDVVVDRGSLLQRDPELGAAANVLSAQRRLEANVLFGCLIRKRVKQNKSWAVDRD